MTANYKTWYLEMFCEDCGKRDTLKYWSPKRDPAAADEVRAAWGWHLNEHGKVTHLECPKAA